MKKKILQVFVMVIITVAIVFGGKWLIEELAYKDPEVVHVPVYIERPPAEPTIVEKTHFREAFVEEIEAKQELITLEVELKEEIELDDSWGGLDILKKRQKIIYTGIGIYTTDLNTIGEDSILIDDERKIVQIKLNAPSPKSLTIDENRTVFQAIDNGVFRQSTEIKLSSSEHQTLMIQVKAAMLEKMNESTLLDNAKSSAKSSIINLYNKILQGLDAGDYSIDVIFE